jgi:hypothetical protein
MVLYDVLNCSGGPVSCASYTVSGGTINNISVAALWGAVLVPAAQNPNEASSVAHLPPTQVTLTSASPVLPLPATDITYTTVTAAVTDLAGQPLPAGVTVSFDILTGATASFTDPRLATTTTTSANTNASGQASVTLWDMVDQTEAIVVRTRITAHSGVTYSAPLAILTGYADNNLAGSTIAQTGIGPHTVTLDANLSAVKNGRAEPVISLARFNANPVIGSPPASVESAYVDVAVLGDTTNLDSVVVSLACSGCNGTSEPYWWDPATNQWKVVTPSSAYNVAGGKMTITFTASTTPSVSTLNGTPFVASQTAPTAVLASALTVQAFHDRLELAWRSAIESKLAGFQLYRRPTGGSEWTLLQSIPLQYPGQNRSAAYTYQDRSVDEGQVYEYWLFIDGTSMDESEYASGGYYVQRLPLTSR